MRQPVDSAGTDLSPYCDEHGGAVLNVTIDRYAFASILRRSDGRIEFEADDAELTEIFEPHASLAEASSPFIELSMSAWCASSMAVGAWV